MVRHNAPRPPKNAVGIVAPHARQTALSRRPIRYIEPPMKVSATIPRAHHINPCRTATGYASGVSHDWALGVGGTATRTFVQREDRLDTNGRVVSQQGPGDVRDQTDLASGAGVQVDQSDVLSSGSNNIGPIFRDGLDFIVFRPIFVVSKSAYQ
jgi:hypothetical protein